ncbi:fluoride efflux transporter CrcB [Salinibacillus xinjiangensis]|uniref:Fluoride-specific ion channel FluC n=1 Tax=Salinibacillus xinjiangensis TaxID=1229268 RepID=A0A6G1X2B1_9BACI|nr:fluoride efflux transporter CrcB [Salinibacillus xinjiangensis]MRG85137.1 fluoride efflux transporter CrcB [Salinibacillus xinjiangensis]
MIFYVFLGGSLGALSRAYLSHVLNTKQYTWGTWIANILGSFLLGLLIANRIGDEWQHLLGIGFCGAFTTFSTFSLEIVKLLEQRAWKVAFIYILTSLSISFLVVYITYLYFNALL